MSPHSHTNHTFFLSSIAPTENELGKHSGRGVQVFFVIPNPAGVCWIHEYLSCEYRRVLGALFPGQMIYMDNWKMMMYLGTPVMPDLNSLINTGLYINDLSMHDFSR